MCSNKLSTCFCLQTKMVAADGTVFLGRLWFGKNQIIKIRWRQAIPHTYRSYVTLIQILQKLQNEFSCSCRKNCHRIFRENQIIKRWECGNNYWQNLSCSNLNDKFVKTSSKNWKDSAIDTNFFLKICKILHGFHKKWKCFLKKNITSTKFSKKFVFSARFWSKLSVIWFFCLENAVWWY